MGKEEWRGMHGLEKKYNLVIGFPDKMFMFLFFPRISLYFAIISTVGAGLSGAVIAERASKVLGLKVILN